MSGLGLQLAVLLVTLSAGVLTAAAVAAEVAIPDTSTAGTNPSLVRAPSVDEPMLGGDSTYTNGGGSNSDTLEGPPLPGDTFATLGSESLDSSTSDSSHVSPGPANNSVAQQNLGFGGRLRPYEQCGGIGGYCNATTIGVPCGDHSWSEVVCPDMFTCVRQNETYWSCQPQTADAAQKAAMEANGTQQATDNASQALTEDGNFTSAAAVGDGTRTPGRNGAGVIRVCGPGDLKRDSVMCNMSIAPNGVILLNKDNGAGHIRSRYAIVLLLLVVAGVLL